VVVPVARPALVELSRPLTQVRIKLEATERDGIAEMTIGRSRSPTQESDVSRRPTPSTGAASKSTSSLTSTKPKAKCSPAYCSESRKQMALEPGPNKAGQHRPGGFQKARSRSSRSATGSASIPPEGHAGRRGPKVAHYRRAHSGGNFRGHITHPSSLTRPAQRRRRHAGRSPTAHGA
jgi:hypothetical protein